MIDDIVCPSCGNSVDQYELMDNGKCEYCNESAHSRRTRIRQEAEDAFLDGRPMSSEDY